MANSKPVGVAYSDPELVAGTTITGATITGGTISGATIAGGDQTVTSITGADASLDIAGLAAAQGGSVTTTGGTSSTSGNAGGAVALVGGTPGATGAGGAASVTGGPGGATSGTGGAAAVAGGAGTAGNAVGGAASVTGGAGQGTGAGGAAALVGGASGAGATGNSGAVSITGGAAASSNGSGGQVSLSGGAKTGSGAKGGVDVTGLQQKSTTATAITSATSLVLADSGGIFTVAQSSAYAISLPSPTAGAGLRYLFQLVSPGAFNVTIVVTGSAATFEGTIINDVTSVIPCTGSTITFASGSSALGDWVECISTGTGKFFVRACTSTAGGITIA